MHDVRFLSVARNWVTGCSIRERVSQTDQRGQANLITILILLGIIVAGVWGWNHLSFDTQDFIIEEVVPVLFLVCLVGAGLWIVFRKICARRYRIKRRDELIAQFQKERSRQKKFDLAVELIELNNYELPGLESIATPMAEVFISVMKTAVGDKQHRIRGMAASHLGVLQHRESIPLLMRALEDDHAYVRGSAALALGRMRAVEAKDKLEYMMKEDWDQTVRSRSREAVERIR